MKHIQGFNEKFNWNKLNIFSSKKKEELEKKEEVNKDDEALARAIYSTLRGDGTTNCKVKGDDVTGDGERSSFVFEYDGDKFSAGTGNFSVNGQKLDCSKETKDKFYKLFKSKKEQFKKKKEDSEKKETKDKLRDKYKVVSTKKVEDRRQGYKGIMDK